MNIKDKLKDRMYPQDVSDGTYLAARADSGQVYLGEVMNTEHGQRFIRRTVNVYADGISAIETSSEPLSHYILISRVEENENGC